MRGHHRVTYFSVERNPKKPLFRSSVHPSSFVFYNLCTRWGYIDHRCPILRATHTPILRAFMRSSNVWHGETAPSPLQPFSHYNKISWLTCLLLDPPKMPFVLFAFVNPCQLPSSFSLPRNLRRLYRLKSNQVRTKVSEFLREFLSFLFFLFTT